VLHAVRPAYLGAFADVARRAPRRPFKADTDACAMAGSATQQLSPDLPYGQIQHRSNAAQLPAAAVNNIRSR
jgi:hypothetical protein